MLVGIVVFLLLAAGYGACLPTVKRFCPKAYTLATKLTISKHMKNATLMRVKARPITNVAIKNIMRVNVEAVSLVANTQAHSGTLENRFVGHQAQHGLVQHHHPKYK